MEKDCVSLVTPLPGQSFFPVLYDSILNAKHTILIMQYQWNFYIHQPENLVQQLNQALIKKLNNGIKCKILLNKEGRAQHLTKINSEAKGFLAEAGAIVKLGKSFPINHSKLWLIDDDTVILGSHNLSGRSFTVNNECSALIKNKAVFMEFKRYFDSLFNII